MFSSNNDSVLADTGVLHRDMNLLRVLKAGRCSSAGLDLSHKMSTSPLRFQPHHFKPPNFEPPRFQPLHFHRLASSFPVNTFPGSLMSSSIFSRHLATSSDNAPSGRRGKIKEMMKVYGVPFLIVESTTYAISVATFYILLSNGQQMSDILMLLEKLIDVDYWVNFWGIDKSILTGNGSKLAISLFFSEITTPFRLPLDLILLLQLKKYKIIGKPKS